MATISDFTKVYDVQPNTIRQWSKTFADFLTPGANPPKGETRVYSDADGQVIALIADMRQDHQSYESIHAALAAGDRGQWPPDAPPVPQDAPGQPENTLQLITHLTAKASQLEGELGAIKGERDHLRNQLDIAQDARRTAEIHAAELQTELRILRELTDDKTPQGEKSSFWSRLFNRNP